MVRYFRYPLIFILFSLSATGQHFQFSQFYAAPMYLNPAFTGANVCSRFSLNYRDQWSGIPGYFKTYQASYDHTVKQIQGGIGFQVLNDVAGPGALTSTQISGLYAYEARINPKYYGRAGISIGSVQRKVDYNAFTFGDQISREGAGSSIESFGATSVSYFDVATGILIFGKSMWAGVSINHLTKPNQSLVGGISPLPTEFKLHGGYKYVFEEVESSNRKIQINHSVTFALNYKRQEKFNQLDAGVYYNKNLIVAGIWYRGIPLIKPMKYYENRDALIFLFGIQVARYKIGYSYDYTMSSLTNAVTGGSHEISMSYQLCARKKSKKRRAGLISCPKF